MLNQLLPEYLQMSYSYPKFVENTSRDAFVEFQRKCNPHVRRQHTLIYDRREIFISYFPFYTTIDLVTVNQRALAVTPT